MSPDIARGRNLDPLTSREITDLKIKLAYGKAGLWVDLPDQNLEGVLDIKPVEPLQDPQSAVLEGLENPASSPPLWELAHGKRNACIVISDITRPVPNETILPPMLKVLQDSDIPKENITILVGTGLHRPNTEEELITMVGEHIVQNYKIVNHLSREKDTLSHLGETLFGVPVYVNTLYLESDLKIATSLIEPHLMAGYSGGRKAICPGICGVETVKVLHGYEILSSPRAAEGIIDGNPVHQQMLEVAHKAGVDFSLNVAINGKRKITGLFCGELEAAHRAGVKFVERQSTAYLDELADIVITTSAGYPLDLTFYQTIKAMTAALPVLKQDGTLIVASRCTEGVGSSEFSRLLNDTKDPENFLQTIKKPMFFCHDQWQVQEMCKALKRGEVLFYSEGIDSEQAQSIMVQPVASVEDGVQQALQKSGRDAKIAVIPKGPYVLPKIRKAV